MVCKGQKKGHCSKRRQETQEANRRRLRHQRSLRQTRSNLMAKIAHLEAKIEKTEDVDELQKLTVA
jgi:predicted ribosome quality control (RQC) complex YloA/Tae2 family protein